MFTLLFISGKNWQLSLAELTAYLQARQIHFEVQHFTQEFFTIQTQENLDPKIIAELGGTIKIGQTMLTLPTQQVKEAYVRHNKEAEKQISQAVEKSGIVDQMAKQTEGKIFLWSQRLLRRSSIKFTRRRNPAHTRKLNQRRAIRIRQKSSLHGVYRQETGTT